MASSAFRINGSASPVVASESSTVTLTLNSVTGVRLIEWSIVGQSSSAAGNPTITRSGTPSGSTATFSLGTAPASGVGIAWIVQCRINGGKDEAGQTVAAYTSTGIVGSQNAGGFLPLVAGESLQRNSITGIYDDINQELAILGGASVTVAPPINYQYFVGAQSPSSGTPDGSIAHPFLTLAAACAKAETLGANSKVTIWLTSEDYTGEGAVTCNFKRSMNFRSCVGKSKLTLTGDNSGLDGTVFVHTFIDCDLILTLAGDTYAQFEISYTAAPLYGSNVLNLAISIVSDDGGASFAINGGRFPGFSWVCSEVTFRCQDSQLGDGNIVSTGGMFLQDCVVSDVEIDDVTEIQARGCIISGGTYDSAGTLFLDATSATTFEAGGMVLAGGATTALLDQALGVIYDDTVVATPTLGVATVQAAIDELKSRGGTGTLTLGAISFSPTLTNGASGITQIETTTNKNNIEVADFLTATLSYISINIPAMPANWDGGTVTAVFKWTANSASTNSVVWGIAGRSLGSGESIDLALGTAAEVTSANGGTYLENFSAATAALTLAGTPAAGERAQFRVYRKGSGADNLAATARLIGVAIYYTVT